MSNYWDVYCIDCKASMGLHINHGEKRIAALLDLVPVLTSGFEALQAVLTADIQLTLGYDEARVNLMWIKEHAGHKLKPRSEYGYLYEDCSKNPSCPTCGSIQLCALKDGHDGPCELKKG